LNRFFARRMLVEELEARKKNRSRHEIKAERLRMEKGRRVKSHKLEDQFSVYRMRPL
jgi:hypothetical protein